MLNISNICIINLSLFMALTIIIPNSVNSSPPGHSKNKSVPESDENLMEIVRYKKLRSEESQPTNTLGGLAMVPNSLSQPSTSYDLTRYDNIDDEIDSLIENFNFMSTTFNSSEEAINKRRQEEFMKKFATTIEMKIETTKGSVRNTLTYFQELTKCKDFDGFKDSLIKAINYIKENMKENALIICVLLNNIFRTLGKYGNIDILDDKRFGPGPSSQPSTSSQFGGGNNNQPGTSGQSSFGIFSSGQPGPSGQFGCGLICQPSTSSQFGSGANSSFKPYPKIKQIQSSDSSSESIKDDDLKIVDMDCNESIPLSESEKMEFIPIQINKCNTVSKIKKPIARKATRSIQLQSEDNVEMLTPRQIPQMFQVPGMKQLLNVPQGQQNTQTQMNQNMQLTQTPFQGQQMQVGLQGQQNKQNQMNQQMQQGSIGFQQSGLPKLASNLQEFSSIQRERGFFGQTFTNKHALSVQQFYYGTDSYGNMLRAKNLKTFRTHISEGTMPKFGQFKSKLAQALTAAFIILQENNVVDRLLDEFNIHSVRSKFLMDTLFEEDYLRDYYIKDSKVLDYMLNNQLYTDGSLFEHLKISMKNQTTWEDELKLAAMKLAVNTFPKIDMDIRKIHDLEIVKNSENNTGNNQESILQISSGISTETSSSSITGSNIKCISKCISGGLSGGSSGNHSWCDYWCNSVSDHRSMSWCSTGGISGNKPANSLGNNLGSSTGSKLGCIELSDLEDVLLRRNIVILVHPNGHQAEFNLNNGKKQFFHHIMVMAAEILARQYFPHKKEKIGIIYKEVLDPIKELDMRKGHMVGTYFLMEDTFPSATIFGKKYDTMGIPILSYNSHIIINKAFGVTNLKTWYKYINIIPEESKTIVTNFNNLSLFTEARNSRIMSTVLTDDYDSVVNIMIKTNATAGLFWGINSNRFRNSAYNILDFPYCSVQGPYFSGNSIEREIETSNKGGSKTKKPESEAEVRWRLRMKYTKTKEITVKVI